MDLSAPILGRPALFVGVLLLAVAVIAADAARAEITLSPLRQVVSEASPVATYRVSNPSSRIVNGRIHWIDLAATETGYAEASGEQRAGLSAAPYLTVWPAYFRLEPGASTSITVALKPGAEPPAGERRSHLLIETEAVRTPLRKAGGAPELDIGIGMTTPVILRGRGGHADAAIGDTRLLRAADGLLEIETHVAPIGDRSAYGRIDVLFTPSGKSRAAATLLKRVENVAAFLDAPRRRIVAPLGVAQLPSGVLEIRYVGRAEYEGREFAARAFEIAAPR